MERGKDIGRWKWKELWQFRPFPLLSTQATLVLNLDPSFARSKVEVRVTTMFTEHHKLKSNLTQTLLLQEPKNNYIHVGVIN